MTDPLFQYDALWEYQVVTNETPADPSAVVVPDIDWLGPVQAPFGNSAPADGYPVENGWTAGTALWIRRALVVDGLSAVKISGRIENACYVYLDGVYLGAFNPSNVQRTDSPDWFLIIPQALATEGTHELAVLCLDEIGGEEGSSGTYVYVEAAYLQPVFPFWPSVPLRESLKWVTDVLIAEDGSEDRTNVRVVPRQSFSLSCYIPRPYLRLAANTLYGARNDQWLVPIWPFVQSLGAVDAGEFELTVSTANVDFSDSSLVLIWQSPTLWQIVGVDEVADANTLTLIQPTEAFTDAYVIPLRPGYLAEAPDRDFNGARARVRLEYVIEDNADLTVTAPTQYLGQDIYYDVGLLDGDNLGEKIDSGFRILDNDLGAVAYYSPWLNNRPTRVHRMMGEDLAEAWTIRKWLYRRAGRFRPFWQPSFEADLVVQSTGALTTTLLVDSDGYKRFASARDHIAVQTAAGWLPRAITAVAQIDADTVQLTLDTSLAINASAIERVSFLGLKRLDTDRADFEWVGGHVCTVAVPTVEIEP